MAMGLGADQMIPDTTRPFDIAIAGASFVGLAMARALALALPGRIRIALIDRLAVTDMARPRTGSERDQRASAISAGSVAALEAIGVWGEIAPRAQAITGITITDSPLDARYRPPLLGFDTLMADGEPAGYIVENEYLRCALARAVAETLEVTRVAGAQVTGLETSQTHVTLSLTTSAGEPSQPITARLAIAADGRRSALRQLAGIKTIAWDYPQSGIVTTIAHELPHGGRAVQHFLPSGPFALLPLVADPEGGPERRTSLVWSEDRRAVPRIMALDDAQFLAEIERRFGGDRGALTLAGPREAYPLDFHLARTFIAPRVALAGDAAHGVHPLAGQGLNLGLRDVAALAEVVVDAVRLGQDVGGQTALERYERWRRFDSTLSSLTMDALNRLFSTGNPVIAPVRRFGVGLVERFGPAKAFFVREAAGRTGSLPRLMRGELP